MQKCIEWTTGDLLSSAAGGPRIASAKQYQQVLVYSWRDATAQEFCFRELLSIFVGIAVHDVIP